MGIKLDSCFHHKCSRRISNSTQNVCISNATSFNAPRIPLSCFLMVFSLALVYAASPHPKHRNGPNIGHNKKQSTASCSWRKLVVESTFADALSAWLLLKYSKRASQLAWFTVEYSGTELTILVERFGTDVTTGFHLASCHSINKWFRFTDHPIVPVF